MRKEFVAGVGFVLSLILVLCGAAGHSRSVSAEPAAKTSAVFSRLGLAFEPNYGQWDPNIPFGARGAGYEVLLGPNEAALHYSGAAVKLRFVGAASSAASAGREPLPGRSNYLVGNDPAAWTTGVPHFRRVHFEDIYPGIDVEYYGTPANLEFDLVVKPGADPGRILFAWDGVRSLEPGADGALILKTGRGEIRQQPPAVFQETAAGRRAVPAAYVLKGARRAGLSLGAYDRRIPLRIDPVLIYASYFGGDAAVTGGNEAIRAVAVDSAGNVYFAGGTQAANLRTTDGAIARSYGGGTFDGFVVKVNAAGSTILYSTYLGGEGSDEAYGLAVDSAGNAYVTGYTDSAKVPVTADAYQKTRRSRDAFAAKLAPDGKSLVWATFLGGAGADEARAIAVDRGGNAWIAGRTYSTDFPASPGAPQANNRGGADAFVAKLDAAGKNLLFSTCLGGASIDEASAIAVDSSGSAYVTGVAWSADFPLTANAYRRSNQYGEAFAAKFTSGGSLAYSTFAGGNSSDYGNAIAVDASGNVYLAGRTWSSDLPVTRPLWSPPVAGGPLFGARMLQGVLNLARTTAFGGADDAFVIVLNNDGSALLRSCYLGGAGADGATAIALSPAGELYVAGETQSAQFPVSANATQKSFGGGDADGFLARLDAADFTRRYVSFAGGAKDDRILALAVDSAGNPLAAGTTSSLNFPATAGSFQAAHAAAGYDGFVTRWRAEDNAVAFSSFFGGTGGSANEEALAIAVDRQGYVYLTGKTYSTDLRVTPGAPQPAPGGGEQADAFVVKIDPSATRLVYCTYLGGRGEDYGTAIAVDSSGAAYVTGAAFSNDFPVSAALQSGNNSVAFVAKLNPQGDRLEYSSVLGGNGGVWSYGIAVDASGAAWFGGVAKASNLPATSGAAQRTFGGGDRDGFVARLNPAGSALTYLTYLGGAGNEDLTGLALDGAGNVYAAGYTMSSNFPVTTGAFQSKHAGGEDGFVTKLNPSGGAPLYSTLLGGSADERIAAIAVEGSGSAYVAGTTQSSNFPTTAGPFQSNVGYRTAFLTKLKADGSALAFSNRFADGASAVAVDGARAAYVTGTATIADFPATEDAWQIGLGGTSDAFLAKFNPEGDKIVYATYLGGTGADKGNAVAVDAAGNAYLAGQAGSRDLPVTEGVFQPTLEGARNAFVAKLDMNQSTPVFERPAIDRVVNEASSDLPVVAPQAIIRIEGTKLAATTQEAARLDETRTQALPRLIAGTKVVVDGSYDLPLFSVSPTEILAQMYGGARVPSATLMVVRSGQSSRTVQVPILQAAPGILAALKENMTEITNSNTVRPGDTILLAVSGAGPTEPGVPSGTPTPASPEVRIVNPVSAWIAPNPQVPPVQCEVLSYVLAPGYVGIALAKVRISPQASADYSEWRLQLKAGDFYSNGIRVYFPPVVTP
ncbi:MAG: SBBP repeat-containing protein [Bryobacteraceae bacterium]|nr:SBBP repeat-containing protein [Bryobacteraceae bacterium]